MFIVLRKSSVKRTLALAVILILIGLNLSNPFKAAASSNLYYLYPYPSNNPLQTSLFWSEEDPAMGAYSLGMWSKIAPGSQLVVGLPKGYEIAEMRGDALGNWLTAKIGNKLKNGSKLVDVGRPAPIPKDSITYERKITADGIEEKIKVEVGEHLKNNDTFEKYLETIKKNLTDKKELPDRKPEVAPLEIPVPPSLDDESKALIGNVALIGGLALMFKILIPVLLL